MRTTTAEKGPMYGRVMLIDSLPISPQNPNGMRQAMPTAEDLQVIMQDHSRVVAGYEVLLQHYQHALKELNRLKE